MNTMTLAFGKYIKAVTKLDDYSKLPLAAYNRETEMELEDKVMEAEDKFLVELKKRLDEIK